MRQVFPGGVALFNQSDLAGSNPALDLLLAGNGLTNVLQLLEVDQPSDVVLAREPGDQATLVLIHSPHDVVGDPRVQDTRATSHDVHAVAAHDLLQLCTMPRDEHPYSAPWPRIMQRGWLLATARQRTYSPPPPSTEMRHAPTPHPSHPVRRCPRLPGSTATRHHRGGQAGDRRRRRELGPPDRRGPRGLARPTLPCERGAPAPEHGARARPRGDPGLHDDHELHVQPTAHPPRVG